VPLKIYNTKSRNKEDFVPLHPPQVHMYVCGITAYDFCHLGHARASVVFDVIYRYLRYKGFEVRYIRNFTDIDDKIIKRAQETGKGWKEIAETYIQAFHEDMQALGNLSPSQEPKATEFVPAMHALIAKLIEKGIAYPAAGDVFYSVRKFPHYGQLSQKNIEELESGARVEVHEAKKDPLDFSLWKAAKPGEPEWDSPWGKGRPGWHIECSAMSTQILGPSLDIHGGGRDLIFPHHENETAQSEGAFEMPFVKYWVHNGFVNLNADKMSKSTGNFLTIRDVLDQYPHEAIRYFLLSAHYRSPLDFSANNMTEALAAIDRVYQTLLRLEDYVSPPDAKTSQAELERLGGVLNSFQQRAEEAMDDDFNTAQVLGICFEAVRELNKFLDSTPDAKSLNEVRKQTQECFGMVGQWMGLFTLTPKAYAQRRKSFTLQNVAMGEDEILKLIAQRKEARKNRDFKRADQIRDQLAASGIILKDNPDGSSSWTVK
jgi:cysteinyl-tRNA synthetase